MDCVIGGPAPRHVGGDDPREPEGPEIQSIAMVVVLSQGGRGQGAGGGAKIGGEQKIIIYMRQNKTFHSNTDVAHHAIHFQSLSQTKEL